MGVYCNKSNVVVESDLEVPNKIEEIEKQFPTEINFDSLIKEIESCDLTSNSTRIETYELKGFNSMTPTFRENQSPTSKEIIKIDTLFDPDKINPNYSEWNINNEDLDYVKDLKFGSMKYKVFCFDKINYEEITTNKYGNPNLINCIYYINEKNKEYFKNLFTIFKVEEGEYEVNIYDNGNIKRYFYDNKIIKKTPFIHNPESNFWIYFLEKAISTLQNHYLNTIPLIASDIFNYLTPCPTITLIHNKLNKKDLYETLRDYKKNHPSYIIFAEKETLDNEEFIKENFLSAFINKLFKINGHKYIEIFTPCYGNYPIKSAVVEEDLKVDQTSFSKEKLQNRHYSIIKYEAFYKYYKYTKILQYNPTYKYTSISFDISDSNINLIKFKVEKKQKCFLSFHLSHPYLFRFVLSKLVITENYLRRVRTMSSKDDDDIEDSYYIDEVDYNFEYIDSIYEYNSKGIIEKELEEATYCLLFNICTNNQSVTLGAYSEYGIEFIAEPEKITKEQLNQQIKTLFISFIKKDPGVVKSYIHENKDLISYESLINSKFGYSLFMVENVSEDLLVDLNLFTDCEGMNLITKEFDETNSVQISIPPKNIEIVILEWEKNIDEVSVFLNSSLNVEKINPFFNPNSLDSTMKKFISGTFVYYFEIQYRNGIFIVFVNDDTENNFIVRVQFEKISNLMLKGLVNEELEGKNFKLEVDTKCYKFFNLKAVNIEDDISYKLNIKVTKNILGHKNSLGFGSKQLIQEDLKED